MEVQLYLPSALDGCEWSNSRPVCLTVTYDPGSKPDQKYARPKDRQNYVGKNKVKFRTSSKRISLVYNILVHCEGVDFEVTGIHFGSVSSPFCVCVCANWKGYVVKHNSVN